MPSERRLNLVRISQRELLIYFRPKQNLSQNLLIQRIVGNFLFYPARLVISSYYSLTCNSSPRPQDQIVSCTSAGSRFCLPCYELKMLIFILFLILFLIFLILFFEVQMLLRCCFIHTSISKLIHLCLLYLCSCLELGLFMPYLCDLFFIFIFIFIMINLKNKDTLAYFSESISCYFWMIRCMKNFNNFQIAIGQPYGVAKYLLNFFLPIQHGVAYKKVAYKKSVYLSFFPAWITVNYHDMKLILEQSYYIGFINVEVQNNIYLYT